MVAKMTGWSHPNTLLCFSKHSSTIGNAHHVYPGQCIDALNGWKFVKFKDDGYPMQAFVCSQLRWLIVFTKTIANVCHVVNC